jgi:hypothetical protein
MQALGTLPPKTNAAAYLQLAEADVASSKEDAKFDEPAAEKRQGTKSRREVRPWQCRELWGFSRVVEVEKDCAARSQRFVCYDCWVKRQASGGWLHSHPAASAYDRRHECTQAVRRNAARPYSQLQAVRDVSEAIGVSGWGEKSYDAASGYL